MIVLRTAKTDISILVFSACSGISGAETPYMFVGHWYQRASEACKLHLFVLLKAHRITRLNCVSIALKAPLHSIVMQMGLCL